MTGDIYEIAVPADGNDAYIAGRDDNSRSVILMKRDTATGALSVRPDQPCFDVSSAPVTPGPAASSRIAALVSSFFRARPRFTTVRRLVVTDIPAGASVQVRCKGKGCRFKTKAAKVISTRAVITLFFRRAKLRPATIENQDHALPIGSVTAGRCG